MLLIEGREVQITHPDKPYFSAQAKVSKIELVRYYLSVAPGALNGIRDRPVVLKRYVNGAEGEAFYQKRAPESRPGWIDIVALQFPSGRSAEEVVVRFGGQVFTIIGVFRPISNAFGTCSAPSPIVDVEGTMSRKHVSQHPYSLRSDWCMRPPR